MALLVKGVTGEMVRQHTRSRSTEAFSHFAADIEPRLRHALIARFGPVVGREATVDALSYGWEHWSRLKKMRNPVGYLYRVGQTKANRSTTRANPVLPAPAAGHELWVEPGLTAALALLSDRQRTTVLLVHSFEWTHQEVADFLSLSTSSVQRHVERGMRKLRTALEVEDVA